MTWDGSITATNVHIYIDGTEITYAVQTNGVNLYDNAAGDLNIGSNAVGASFNGIFREVAIFNKVLSADEISSLATRPVRNVPKEIGNDIRYWKAVDGVSGTSADGDTITDFGTGGVNCTGVDGANNTGLSWGGEDIVKEQSSIVND